MNRVSKLSSDNSRSRGHEQFGTQRPCILCFTEATQRAIEWKAIVVPRVARYNDLCAESNHKLGSATDRRMTR
jgi:hypothetical protein